jgi:choline-sulfatase
VTGRRTAAAGSLLVLLAGAAACSRGERHPPVILISVDTLRADHLPAYGYKGVETPALDALRRDSILYENAYAHVPLTVPSHAALLTGLLPFANGVRDNSGFRLAPSILTIAGALKTAGYATGAAVSTFALRRDRGLASGFDFYDDELSDERPGVETAARLERWIDGAGDRPLFAFLHVYEPHAPYAPPEPFRSRYAARPYDGEIAAADAAVGGFLEHLKKRGLYRRALIVFLSDHGEGLNDHGEDEHGVFLYREAIRVPLFVRRPGGEEAGSVVGAPVGLVDVFPSIARAAGVAVPPDRAGVPLFGPGAARADEGRRIYSETLYPRLQLGWSDLASLTDGGHQYIEAPRPELYDLKADPGEKRDLAGSRPPELRQMRAALAGIPRSPARPEKSTPEEVEKLGSLGYIHVQSAAGGALPDPKDRVAALKDYKRLFALFYARQDPEAVLLARRILERDPAILSVSRILALSLDRLGRTAEGERVLAAALSRSGEGGTAEDREQAAADLSTLREKRGDFEGAAAALSNSARQASASPETRQRLARLYLESGKPQDAIALLSSVLPDDPDGLDLRGAALADAGRPAEARRDFVAAVAANPRHAGALFHLGALSLKEGDAAAARQWLERSLAARPHSASTFAALGLARSALGDPEGALDCWDKALALDPTLYDTLYNRAVLLGKLGRADEARKGLEEFLRVCPPARFPREREEARRLLAGLASARARR